MTKLKKAYRTQYHRTFTPLLLTPASIREPVPQPTNDTGSARQWRPCTPAIAPGLTDRVWTLRGCGFSACHPGPSHKRSKPRVSTTIVRVSGEGRPEEGKAGTTKPDEPGWRDKCWLVHATLATPYWFI